MALRNLSSVLACLLAACFVSATAAASIAQRSPFTQGHWWNPARSGSGFDIFNASDQVMVIWYTYDAASRPVWYTAQGNIASLGKKEAWPLLKHRWVAGQRGDPEVVGSLTLNVRHPQGMDVVFKIGSDSGSWPIVPFFLSGTQLEVDHSGSWYDPSHSGWGVTVTQQGDVLGAVLYTYDAQGAPTWFAGFDRGRTDSAVQVYACSGSCPTCAYRTTQTTSAGQLGFTFASEVQSSLRPQLTYTPPAGVELATSIIPLSRPASSRGADRQLASFDDEPSLKAFLDQAMMALPAGNGFVDFSPAPASTPYSSTNLQEQGVDEADVMKNDGTRAFTFDYDVYGVAKPALRVAALQQEPLAVKVQSASVPLSGLNASNAGLYLDGNRLVAVYGTVPPWGGWSTVPSWRDGVTYVELFDTTGPVPLSRWHAQIDGHPVTSRRIGDRLYVVSRYVPTLPNFVNGATFPPQVTTNQQILAATLLTRLLPHAAVNGTAVDSFVTPQSVYVPPLASRPAVADFVIVTEIDLAAPRVVKAFAMLGGVETVYASPTSLVLATYRTPMHGPAGDALPEPPWVITDLHQLRLAADGLGIAGSATVEGYLGTSAESAAFRLSDYQGRLRVVTNSGQLWTLTDNLLTVLEPSSVAPGLLKTVSQMPNAKRPQALGKPNESLYATRFVNDRLYAVTFPGANFNNQVPSGAPRVDPLFVVDLSDSTDPRIAGEIEMPGFSTYLHPLPNGLMLGFGQYVQPQSGAYGGLQLSLYDVRDASHPIQKQTVILGDAQSDSALLRDHHALSTLIKTDGTGTIAFPVLLFSHTAALPGITGGMLSFNYSGLARFELRGSSPADMSLVQLSPIMAYQGSAPAGRDPASTSGRSILLDSGPIYVGGGHFWWQNAAGISFGPQ
jgi:uncharacterized secreted protein with C-terminal beta-propeller domain